MQLAPAGVVSGSRRPVTPRPFQRSQQPEVTCISQQHNCPRRLLLLPPPGIRRHHCQVPPSAAAGDASATGTDIETDVCVLGAGIIGLCTSLALLRADPSLRVVLVDREQPCAGATGAGQGYLWLAHRDPASPAWQLAVHSKRIWQELLAPTVPQLTVAAVEWQGVGSMLVGSDEEESEGLRQRQQLLAAAGLNARYLTAAEAQAAEPALRLGAAGSALLVPSDAQVNGKATAAAALRACEAFGSRFRALFDEAAQQLEVTAAEGPAAQRRVAAVQTAACRVHAAQGVVVALGAWSGVFLAEQLGDEQWAEAFRPRRGLLLEMPRPEGMPPVQHGLMEQGYTKHYKRTSKDSSAGSAAAEPAAAAAAAPDSDIDITFTATTSASGTLLVGSSREFAGFERSEVPEAVVGAIMERAALFLPGLADVQRQDIHVRMGPRPYATAGFPMVGPVPGIEGLYVAAGHEGSGLTLAPATAELVCDHLLGRTPDLPAAVVDSLRVPYC